LLLVSMLIAELLFVAVTRGFQEDNAVGDAGASGLGQGLQSNRSVRYVNLVSWTSVPCLMLIAFLVVDACFACPQPRGRCRSARFGTGAQIECQRAISGSCESRFIFCGFGVLAGLLSFITQENQTRNQLGDAGAIELGQGLESNGSLQELYLVSCFCSVCCFGGFLVVVTLVAGLE
jgi:hypothetical protein